MSHAKGNVQFPEGSLISYPRKDGMVQHKDWNEYLDTHQHPTWANRWMFLQDTLVQFLGRLTKEQLVNNLFNFANVRFMNNYVTSGINTGASALGWTWQAHDVSGGCNNRTDIEDGIAFAADYPVPSGPHAGENSLGTWAKDIAGLIPGWEAMGFWCNFTPPNIRSVLYDLYVKASTRPSNELPDTGPEEGVDNTLPSKPALPDNELPVPPLAPDNSLPDVGPGGPGISNELPKPPGHVSGQPLPGHGSRPDNSLPPGAPDGTKPDNELPPNPLPKKTLGK